MQVREVMTTDVRSVRPETSLKDVAALLVTTGISGVPVRDEAGRVLGVVSEQDILLKEQGPPDRPDGALRRVFRRVDEAEVAKAAARTAREAMTAPPVTIAPERAVAAAARLLVEHGIKRLPVVDRDGRLVGIVTRTDLVRVFTRSDAEIEREIQDEVLERALWAQPGDVQVSVAGGEVQLRGEVEHERDAEILPRLVARVPGVVSVDCLVRGRVPVAG
jgi:CBS domain-containing protein